MIFAVKAKMKRHFMPDNWFFAHLFELWLKAEDTSVRKIASKLAFSLTYSNSGPGPKILPFGKLQVNLHFRSLIRTLAQGRRYFRSENCK